MLVVLGGLPGLKKSAFQVSQWAVCSWNWCPIGVPPGYMNHEECKQLSAAVTMDWDSA
jgi:hypothetical protein